MLTVTAPRGLRHLLGVLAALAVVTLSACSPTTSTAALADASPELADGWNAVAVDGAPRVADIAATDQTGQAFDLAAAVRARPTLLYVGYTNCPDICPVHLATLSQALEHSTVRPEQLNVVFLSADPERDTTAALADYMTSFHPSFVALRASADDVERLVGGLGMPAPAIEPAADGDPDRYTVGHPGQVLAIGTDGRAHLAYPFGTRQSHWVADLPRLARQDWS